MAPTQRRENGNGNEDMFNMVALANVNITVL